MNKKEKGQYFTTENPFVLEPFQSWLLSIKEYKTIKCIEPFAGSNNIKKMLENINIKLNWTSFDIEPQESSIIQNDSILNFPKGFDLVITNPPYLAKNSAKRMKLKFPDTHYDDLYKLALEKMIDNVRYVAAIIPESFITSGLFHKPLVKVISLEMKMFDDTECPVCLALFDNQKEDTNFEIYRNNSFVMNYAHLKTLAYSKKRIINKINFYNPEGIIGLVAIDNTKNPSIKFCEGSQISSQKVKKSSRSITRISLDPALEHKIMTEIGLKAFIELCNKELINLRSNTNDLVLTAFKGLRADGQYRRRLSFDLARDIIEHSLQISLKTE